MLATSASAACFAVPSVTAANLAALLLGASITIVHAPHISVNVNTTDATTGAAPQINTPIQLKILESADPVLRKSPDPKPKTMLLVKPN